MKTLNQKQLKTFLEIADSLRLRADRKAGEFLTHYNQGLITWGELGKKLVELDEKHKKALERVRDSIK